MSDDDDLRIRGWRQYMPPKPMEPVLQFKPPKPIPWWGTYSVRGFALGFLCATTLWWLIER